MSEREKEKPKTQITSNTGDILLAITETYEKKELKKEEWIIDNV